MSAILEKVNTY